MGRGAPLVFQFEPDEGSSHPEIFDAASTRGRATLVLLVTTFDMGSQLMAQRVNQLLHTHVPRINAGAVVMEPPKYGLFADAYRDGLKLDYPVVLADHATLEGRGPFGIVEHIPTLLVLDKAGREVARFLGPVEESDIVGSLEVALR